MAIDVHCLFCANKIGVYNGPVGLKRPIEAQHFVRNDGTSPPHGACAAGHCPHCGMPINEFEATLSAAWESLIETEGEDKVMADIAEAIHERAAKRVIIAADEP